MPVCIWQIAEHSSFFCCGIVGERGAYLSKAGGGGGLHHIAVFFGYGVAVVCFGCLEILIQRAEHGQLPAIILAAAHYGKGVVIVLAVGSSALVLHLIEKSHSMAIISSAV